MRNLVEVLWFTCICSSICNLNCYSFSSYLYNFIVIFIIYAKILLIQVYFLTIREIFPHILNIFVFHIYYKHNINNKIIHDDVISENTFHIRQCRSVALFRTNNVFSLCWDQESSKMCNDGNTNKSGYGLDSLENFKQLEILYFRFFQSCSKFLH